MKVRIKDNSIRLRLMQSEVTQFGEKGHIAAHILFDPVTNNALTYQLQQSQQHQTIEANFANNCITVFVPQQLAQEWVTSNLIGLSHAQTLDAEKELSILIEKDFQCLTERPGEDESDAFPNPNTEC